MKKKYWKSLSSGKASKEQVDADKNEFPKTGSYSDGASILKDKNLTRRSFIKTMGASLMLAGVSACAPIRKPKEKIFPYAHSPEHLVPGNPIFYATSVSRQGSLVGLLAKSLEGRPIKIEGNPLFPENQGSASHFDQASILELYDPDRVKDISLNGSKSDATGVRQWLNQSFNALHFNESSRGEKTGILFNEVSSITSLNLLGQIKEKFPAVKFYEYSPDNQNNVYQGVRNITGESSAPQIDFKKAKVVISFGDDFLGNGPHSSLYNREFMASRKDANPNKFNRLYQFENTFSITGGVADHRFVLKRNNIDLIVYSVLVQLYQKSISRINRSLISLLERKLIEAASTLKSIPFYSQINKVVDDLFSNQGQAVVTAGRDLSPFVHSLVVYINQILNAPVAYYNPLAQKTSLFGDPGQNALSKLVEDAKSGELQNLLVIGGDPVYNAYADLGFKGVYSKLNTLFLTEKDNATAKDSNLVVPKKHFLENWSDNVSENGYIGIVQPLISPLYPASLSEIDLFNIVLDNKTKEIYGVNQSVRDLGLNWGKLLHDGLAQVPSLNRQAQANLIDINSFFNQARANDWLYKEVKGLELDVSLDYSVFDGRYVNNSWLQELPDPITKLTWDNAVHISHHDAKELKVKNYDLVELELNGNKIEGAVWVTPGQARNSITIKLGYGQKGVGKIAEGSGFDAYSLFFNNKGVYANGLKIKKLGKTYIIASVQDHWNIPDEIFEGGPSSNSQNGRPLVREGSVEDHLNNPRFARDEVEVPHLKKDHERLKGNKNPKEPMFAEDMSVFSEQKYDKGYQWGMAIDLSTCTGCNACVVACQSENNIPVVGKEMVLNGREMHWIRLDRYFEGDVENPRMVHQPVNCMQCEQAPCEQVCPVAATVHSKEGLNDMVYNRCIGTRFCSNNCPFKVRRFNFFDYHQRSPHSQKRVSSHLFELFREPSESLQLQFNPDVTVRMRGVMEKCTYCVQRINKARVKSRNEERLIKDGEIKVACEQTCPTGSIVFGDINDPSTKVSQLKKKDRNYHLLAELNIKPRTTYLASINNPNKEIKS